ncbi:hypothetical protein RclHR1_07810003 [Rhizophagus clarus]|uniref:Uncharacterized protein n=1 Tax=Rhizophagus clarus TaxID=94130 RepID=A0A2Z6S0C5_9GLOM|nr:hypothetical protein RclHR1_07810003 [Rhizophagus clarus]
MSHLQGSDSGIAKLICSSRTLLSGSHKFLKLLSSMQSIDSLRELNAKFLAEIAELRKKNAKISELREKLLKFAEVEAENVKLRQIIEENAKRDAENAELKTEVARLRHDIEKMKQQTQVITEVQDACSIEDIPPWK